MTYTQQQFLTAAADILSAARPHQTVIGRTLRLVTADSHAAHALELRARRGGIRVKVDQTDDHQHRLTLTHFGQEPRRAAGPLHSCGTPRTQSAWCDACGGMR